MKTILHCDANNFYASVEAKLNPALRGIPMAVTGNPEKRHGIILAKSEQAKKYGVCTGETLWQARQKCPEIVFVSPHYDEYVDYSNRLFAMYTEYTDLVEPFGIDECWLDCSGSLRLFGSGENIADTLRHRVKEELGLTISVGVSFTKIFAKLGSDYKKPDATTVITSDNYRDIVWRLPVSDLLMVGRQTAKLFNRLNINTIGDLAQYDPQLLRSYLGINADKLHDYANGIDSDEINHYQTRTIPKSVGHSTTTPHDITTLDEATAVLVSLSEMVAVRLRRYRLLAGGVGVSVRYATLKGNHKSNLILSPTNNAKQLANEAIDILKSMHSFDSGNPIRQLGIFTYKLSDDSIVQRSLFDTDSERDSKLERSVDDIRKKYGYASLQKGITLKHSELCEGLHDQKFKPFKKSGDDSMSDILDDTDD